MEERPVITTGAGNPGVYSSFKEIGTKLIP